MIAIGIDPGGAHLGTVARRGEELLAANVLDLDKNVPPLVRADPVECRKLWAKLIVELVDRTIEAVAFRHGLGDPSKAVRRGALVLAAENVVTPHPHGGRANGSSRVINPGPIIDTAVVLGVLLGCWPDLLLIRPHRNGSGPVAAYPAELRPRGAPLGGPSVHARSAWDVAGAALMLARLERGTRT